MHADLTAALALGIRRLNGESVLSPDPDGVVTDLVDRFARAILEPDPVGILPPDPDLLGQRLDELAAYRVGPAAAMEDELTAHNDGWLAFLVGGDQNQDMLRLSSKRDPVDSLDWIGTWARQAARSALYAGHPAFTPLFHLIRALKWAQAGPPERRNHNLTWAVVECRETVRILTEHPDTD